jgi:hypothetical protein
MHFFGDLGDLALRLLEIVLLAQPDKSQTLLSHPIIQL